jgi:hypothetical protein
MQPQTMSLFEQEMRDQVAAAREAVAEAERRGDPLLVQAAHNHHDALVDLARRNGVTIDAEAATDVPAPAEPTAAGEPLTTPAG